MKAKLASLAYSKRLLERQISNFYLFSGFEFMSRVCWSFWPLWQCL